MADCEFIYRLCQLASQFSFNRVDDDLFWAKLPIFIWNLLSFEYKLVLLSLEKSMSLTMQELSKRSETLCQVWTITNWLYIEMQGPIID